MNKFRSRLVNEFSDKDYAHAYMNSHQSSRLATQIKVLREQRGLTQSGLAELSGLKQERISKLEDVDYDSWTLSTLRKLAKAFDTTLHVSFTPFSEGIKDVENFSREFLEVDCRDDDLRKFLIKSDIDKSILSASYHQFVLHPEAACNDAVLETKELSSYSYQSQSFPGAYNRCTSGNELDLYAA